MPIYEYECMTNPEHKMEELVKMDDPNKNFRPCNKCRGIGKRIISKSSFHLKGDTWAKDNYTRKKPSYVDRPFKPLVD